MLLPLISRSSEDDSDDFGHVYLEPDHFKIMNASKFEALPTALLEVS